jgi:hypothetical protein
MPGEAQKLRPASRRQILSDVLNIILDELEIRLVPRLPCLARRRCADEPAQN